MRETQTKRRAALELQEQWTSWLKERESLRADIKRGIEYLDQVVKEHALARAGLEQWPAYERHCGKNPVFDYAQTLLVSERIEQFLPDWLKRREAQLNALIRTMEE